MTVCPVCGTLYQPPKPTRYRQMLREARERLGFEQSDVAQRLDKSVRTFGGWERGESSPTWEDMGRWWEVVCGGGGEDE